MKTSFAVIGVKTPLIRSDDDLAAILIAAAKESPAGGIRDGDILVIAESPVATAEGRAVRLDGIVPSGRAVDRVARSGSSASGSTFSKSWPVSGIETRGPAAQRPRQPTRFTSTSVTPASAASAAMRAVIS